MKRIILISLLSIFSLNIFAQEFGCISGDCDDGYGTYIWEADKWKGDKYTGDWKDGVRHGFGTYYYNSGAKYIGEYNNNKMHGQGSYYWENGDKYTGGWGNGARHGNGVYVFADGSIKKGIWKDGKYEGKDNISTGCISGNCSDGYGTYIWEDGERYEGNWKNGLRNGSGTNIWANGAKYSGNWLDDKKVGYGSYSYKSESKYATYTGYWKINKMNGKGTFKWKNGKKYIGDMVNNYFTGQGTMYYTDGTIESGQWENDIYKGKSANYGSSTGCFSGDCSNGWGVYKWESGERYEGNWENGKRNGEGTNYFVSGAEYSGSWKDNDKHGYGKYYYKPSSKYKSYIGNFVMGKLTGQATLLFKSGQKYVGSFVNAYYEGEGTMYYADGTVKSGIWEKDNYIGKSKENIGCISGNCNNGYGTYTFESGSKYVGNWTSGKYDGKGTFYYSNGDKYMGMWKNDVKSGYGTYLWTSGTKYTGDWMDGKYTGVGTMYYTDGTSKTGQWKENTYVGPVNSNQGPMVTWLKPEYYTTTSNTPNYTIKVCVKSSTPISTEIIVNGYKQESGVRGYSVVSSSCDYTIERKVSLSSGDNKIKISVKNKYGTSTTEERTVSYKSSSNNTSAKRLALVIGNGNYTTSPLKNPVNDAKAIAQKLESLGFEVMIYTDQNQVQMKKVFRSFGEKLSTNKGTGLFFYAGHGMQVNGENYLVPVNSNIQKEQDIELEAVNIKRLLGEMDYAQNEMNVIILDACRDNPFASITRSTGGRGLAQTNAPQGTFIAYATSPGSVASDGSGSNGLYTQELLKVLSQKGLTIESVFKQVRKNVYEKSSGKQVPWDNSSIFEDFYFNDKN